MIRFEQDAAEELAHIVAQQFPVFVIGPGCHRVGYDDNESVGWAEVQDRITELHAAVSDDDGCQAFLEEFYVSKLSEERQARARDEELPLLREKAEAAAERRRSRRDAALIHRGGAEQPEFAPWRTALAEQVLQAYRLASRCLGIVIARGKSPVIDWKKAAITAEAVRSQEDGADTSFSALKESLSQALAIARSLAELQIEATPSEDDLEVLGALVYPVAEDLRRRGPPDEAWRESLQILLPRRIQAGLATLRYQCFDKPFEPLLGANVEWLGDLLWHIISSDTDLQPSQADLAFYVTLCEEDGWRNPRDLRRAHYGDRLSTAKSIARLTDHRLSDDSHRSAAHQRLIATIARCLWAQHGVVARAAEIQEEATKRPAAPAGNDPSKLRDDERWVGRPAGTLVLALATDYGDHLEAELRRTMDDGESLHVILPVWLRAEMQPTKLDWLLGSARQTALGLEVSWQWLEEAGEVAGPVVIKLNGSTRMPFGPDLADRVSALPNTLRSKERDGYFVERALLYDEHDRLTAMRSFEALMNNTGQTHRPLLTKLAARNKGLLWRGRSLIVLGQQFADWVPRLQMFSQRWSGVRDGRPVGHRPHAINYWAIDRDFDWPERALLEALGIAMVRGELDQVARLLDSEVPRVKSADMITKVFAQAYSARSSR